MTQAAEQRRHHPRLLLAERRIIERPRLMRRLDGSGARTILLLAPAGFGKTTLARQWRATLCRSVLLALTPAHRDVTVIARDLARSIEDAGVEGFREFMEQYIRARSSPQAEAASLGRALADGLERAQAGWVVVDDYHDVAEIPEAEELLETLLARTGARFLVCSRVRPRWASARRQLYGELDELDQRLLAMDRSEAEQTLGRSDQAARELIALADGWPAVLALAAPLEVAPPAAAAPEALHRYLAEEFLGALSPEAQLRLTDLALLPEAGLQLDGLPSWDVEVLLVMLDADGSIHRLLREFLLTRARQTPDCDERVDRAVTLALEAQNWDRAFELIDRFHLDDRIEEAAERAFEALVDSGQIWTLAQFTSRVANRVDPASGIVALIDAERALDEGRNPPLVAQLARTAQRKLGIHHKFAARAALLEGEALFHLGDIEGARDACARAEGSARHERDVSRTLFCLARSAIHDETSDAGQTLGQLSTRQHRSASELMGYAINALLHENRIGAVRISPVVAEALEVRTRSSDPRRRAALVHVVAAALCLRAEYRGAQTFNRECLEIIDDLDLHFARPHALVISAAIKLGQRRVRDASRDLDQLGKEVERHDVALHDLNHRSLRARLLLAIGQAEAALPYVEEEPRRDSIKSMIGEYLATRGMVQAILGSDTNASESCQAAMSISRAADVRSQVYATRAIVASNAGNTADLVAAFRAGAEVDAWDPFVLALRGHSTLAEAARAVSNLAPFLRELCDRSEDNRLARILGVKFENRQSPDSILTSRESEVLDLLTQGLRNSEIARGLFISEATVKVHIRHIFEKLGVRTRAQAVAMVS